MTDNKRDQIDAVNLLRSYDHCFISQEGVDKIVQPFGLNGNDYTWEAEDSRDQLKGLALDTGPGTKMRGADAADLAEALAFRLCGWRGWQQGRGSRLRSACQAMLDHLQK
jgi:hypothetical protein